MQLARRIPRESYTVDYAGFWIRLLAFVIDAFALFAVIWVFLGLWPLAFGLGWMGGSEGAAVSRGEVSIVYWILTVLIPFVMVVAYFVCFWGWRGQTPGKMVMRIRIVYFDGNRIGWGGAAMRFLGFIISFLLVFIGHIWVAFDNRRQGFHDKIADTFVITIPRK